MKNILFFIFALTISINVFAENKVFYAGTPIFDAPGIESNVISVLTEDTNLEVLSHKKVYTQNIPAFKTKWHPIMFTTDFYKISLNDGRIAWISEEIIYDDVNAQALPNSLPNENYSFLILLLLSLFLLFFISLNKQSFFKQFFSTEILESKNIIKGLITLLIFRGVLVSFLLYFAGGLICFPRDENSYFNVAEGIRNLTIANDWTFTIGHPLLYIPFMWFQNATNYMDIDFAFSTFNCWVITPLCLILIFSIVKNLKSAKVAFIVVFLLTILPFIYFPVELHSTQFHKAIFNFPDISPASYGLYYMFFWTGFNSLSDMPTACALLTCIWLCVSGKLSTKKFLLIGFIFAFACLMRVASVMLTPVIIYTYLNWANNERFTLKKTLLIGASVISFFVLIFLPQLLINLQNYGGLLKFPYVLHGNRSEEGFALDSLYTGITFLINTNYIFMISAAVGLFFIKNSYRRNILTFWALPIVVFYMGYPVLGTSPIRFILVAYGGLMASVIFADIWIGMSPKKMIWIVIFIFFNIILACPSNRLTPPFLFNLDLLDWGLNFVRVSVVLIPLITLLSILKFITVKEEKIFFISLLICFTIGSSFLVFLLFLVHLLRASIDTVSKIKTIIQPDNTLQDSQ